METAEIISKDQTPASELEVVEIHLMISEIHITRHKLMTATMIPTGV